MLTKWDPFRELRSVEDELDRMVGQRFARNAWVPPLDVRETEASFEVSRSIRLSSSPQRSSTRATVATSRRSSS